MRELSLDLVNYTYKNSQRSDLAPRKEYVPYGVGTRAISPRETSANWGSGSTLEYDRESDGRSVTPPMAWLEDYWMGRYYGMIQAPTVTEMSLLIPETILKKRRVALPYDGPEAPAVQ